MERFSNFKKEMQSLSISSEKRYLFPGMGPLMETDLPTNEPEYLKALIKQGMKIEQWLTIKKLNDEDIFKLYSDAMDDLIFLTKDQLRNALDVLKQFDYLQFTRDLMKFYTMFMNGDEHPMDIMDFKRSMSNYFICTVPDEGDINIVFLDDLVEEVMNKSGVYGGFIKEMERMIGDAPLRTPRELFRRLNEVQIVYLHRRLTEEGEIIKDSYKDFSILFGNAKGNLQPIKWMGRGYELRKILIALKQKNVTDQIIVENSERFFVDKNGKALKAPNKPKSKYEEERKMKILTKILENLATLDK